MVQDQTGGRYHRMSPSAYALLQKMDGIKTVQQIWEDVNLSGSGDACTQNEMVDLLVQLHSADLLQANTTPDSAALFDRYKKKKYATLKQYLLNPMSIKIPLIDPDAFLEKWAPYFARIYTRLGGILWLAVVLPAVVLAVQHWSELTHNLSDQVLSSSNLLVMALVFPFVKLAHELGHGFAARCWGGPVHEMGIMFLVFAPVPYVNASSSSAFPSKWRRAVVAASGMMIEIFLAAIALYVWLLVESGVVRAVAYNVMIIAGISTLLVNGNPLLRYDGYYIFSDLIEMPNMAQRGKKYLTYLVDRYVFGAHDVDPLSESRGERIWLALYTPLAWCYRMFIMVAIMLFIAKEFFIFGVLLALWSLTTMIIIPLWKAWKHVWRGPTLQRRRQQAQRITTAFCAVVLLLAFVIPAPLRTLSDGVVWLPDDALVRAGEKGFFVDWLAEPGSHVKKGDPLFLLESPTLTAELEVARAKVAEMQASYRAEQFNDQMKAVLLKRKLEQEESVLRQLEERAVSLTGVAEADGVLVAGASQDMPGRFLKKGELIGYVLEKNALIARLVVQQDDIDLVRTAFRSAELRFADHIRERHAVALARPPAGGVNELPTAALGVAGGGLIPTLPNDPDGLKTTERVFMFDLALPDDKLPAAFGERVHARISHGWEPLGWQGVRRLRQLFLSHFGV